MIADFFNFQYGGKSHILHYDGLRSDEAINLRIKFGKDNLMCYYLMAYFVVICQ